MTPPNVLETPKPVSSVMMSSTFGAPLGGRTRAGQYGVDSAALRSIFPPKAGGGGGSCSPPMVVVALGDPGVPAICPELCETATATEIPIASRTAASTHIGRASINLLFGRLELMTYTPPHTIV
jgi:hypothetical protein